MSAKQHDRQLLKELSYYRVPSSVTEEAISMFLQSLDCPRALAVDMLYKYHEHSQLAELGFDPLHYNTLVDIRDAYAATTLLSKSSFLELDYDLDVRALLKFEKFESNCKQTNLRFRDLSTDPQFNGPVVHLHNAVVRKIDSILGEVNIEEIFNLANWGPGASCQIKARDASSANKFQNESGITRQLLDLFPPNVFQAAYAAWSVSFDHRNNFSPEVGNKITTVPKDSKANRVIAIEPGFNLWFQKGIGSYMRKRLLRHGVDLNFQDVNQQFAKTGSYTGLLATIDFSSASDSIAKNLVEAIVSPRWFSLLNACRSHYGVLRGDLIHWEKFSSMGNGFTFELESLIFYATALCCAEYLQQSLSKDSGLAVSVYGDDVIIPTNCVDLFAKMCSFYGFTLNMKKSHYSSAFRESCGKHYYLGIDVTPIYLKDRLFTVPAVYRFANAIRKLAHRRNCLLSCDLALKKLFGYLVSSVPKAFRFRIEVTLGDGGFVSNFDEAAPTHAKYGVEGYRVSHVTDVGKTYKYGAYGLLLARLWGLERRGVKTTLFRNRTSDGLPENYQGSLHPFLRRRRQQEIAASASSDTPDMGNNVSVRGKSVMKLVRSLVPRWYDLGPWQ